MANPEQIEIIKKGSGAWNQWRLEHIGEEIDLSGGMLSRVDLAGAFLYRADLTSADLAEAWLGGVDLTGATLTSAYLGEADLRGAYLERANLTGATFYHTNLTVADLREANLTDAELTGSILHGTNLTKANCANTDFTDTGIEECIFGDVDLSSARGLEFARHSGPSIISIDTIYQSKGKIPEAFLRGAGVPEEFIKLIPSLTEQPIQFYSCFISYSHKDKVFARRLHDALQGRGIRCWLDEKQLLPGHNIYDEVDRGIRLWDKVLLCCSEHSLTSWWVDNEVNSAFAKEQQLQKERGKKALALIPLDLDGYLFKGWNDGKAQQVKARLAADFKGWEHDNAKFEEQFVRVVKALQTDDGREAPPTPRL